MNDQAQSLVMEFLVEKGNAKEINNFAQVSKSTNTPHVQHVLKQLKVKVEYLYREIRFWKQKTHLLARSAKQLLSCEPLVLECYTSYLGSRPPEADDYTEYYNRKSRAEYLEHTVDQTLRIKKLWIR